MKCLFVQCFPLYLLLETAHDHLCFVFSQHTIQGYIIDLLFFLFIIFFFHQNVNLMGPDIMFIL